ncbi:Protein of unknown function [Gryllus bimaculatus]|nr:Protein of unknown function [Gryllus bimaculatus]
MAAAAAEGDVTRRDLPARARPRRPRRGREGRNPFRAAGAAPPTPIALARGATDDPSWPSPDATAPHRTAPPADEEATSFPRSCPHLSVSLEVLCNYSRSKTQKPDDGLSGRPLLSSFVDAFARHNSIHESVPDGRVEALVTPCVNKVFQMEVTIC